MMVFEVRVQKLFDIYCNFLEANNIIKEQIIRINLEDPNYNTIDTYLKLYNYILEKLLDGEMNYIFIDEVQLIPEFQKAIDGLFIKRNCDVYITGSNAYLLSGELATLLSGRYVEIKILPLSFKEYRNAFPNQDNLERLYSNYTFNSAFPYTLALENPKDIRQYLQALYDSIILKDIVFRKQYKNSDILQSVIRFMFDNIGNMCSTSSIANTMTSAGRKISVHTVEDYLTSLCDRFIMYKVNRYDIKGKQYLKTGNKYYVCDIGLRYSILGTKNIDFGHILENVVYLELIRRGYEVYIGKVGNLECDFICITEDGEEYYQVAYSVKGEAVGSGGKTTLQRELAPLEAIKDHNPKYLLTMDIHNEISHNGIKQINVLDWLLK